MIRRFLADQLAKVYAATDKIEAMRHPTLQKWCDKSIEHWTAMEKAILWLAYQCRVKLEKRAKTKGRKPRGK